MVAIGLICSTGLVTSHAQEPVAPDYLTPDWRARVENLKQIAGQEAMSPYECELRLETIWRWANAYALTGGTIPPDLPTWVALHLHTMANPVGDPLQGFRTVTRFVQRVVRELTLKEEYPDQLGTLRLIDPSPRVAGTNTTIELEYTVGQKAIAPGGGIVLFAKWQRIQSENPAGRGYVRARASRQGAQLVAAEPWSRWYPDLTGGALLSGSVQFQVKGRQLVAGDTIRLSIGNTAGGSPGFSVHEASMDAYRFDVFVDFDGEGDLITLNCPSFPILGGADTAYVNAIVPSIVRPGESFDIAIRSEDRLKNPIDTVNGVHPAFDVSLNGAAIGSVPGGPGAIALLEGVTLPSPGTYRFDVRTVDGAITATSNPVWVKDKPESRIFWGDTHGPTGFADGMGGPDGFFEFGRDIARLDFLILSEHDLWMDDWEWKVLQEKTQAYLRPREFTTLAGYEWTGHNFFGGHHNVYYNTRGAVERVPVQSGLNLDALYRGLRERHPVNEVLIVPHAHEAGDWNKSDSDLERLLEIASGHGTFEEFANLYLQNGFHLGFVGSSDTHAGHPGYTGVSMPQLGGLAAVFAQANTPDQIHMELRDRASYATTGERILIDARLNDYAMGRRLALPKTLQFDAEVSGTEPIASIALVKNGEVIHQEDFGAAAFQPHCWVKLSFDSDSRSFDEDYPRPNPRTARRWRGSIELAGGEIISIQQPWYAHPLNYAAARDGANPNRVTFDMTTRGRAQCVFLEIDGATAASQLTIAVAAGQEQAASRWGANRPPEELPAEQLVVSMSQAADVGFSHEMEVERNVDRIGVHIVDMTSPRDRSFSFNEPSMPLANDYYYLRVEQLDGSLAWSSPWWIEAAAN